MSIEGEPGGARHRPVLSKVEGPLQGANPLPRSGGLVSRSPYACVNRVSEPKTWNEKKDNPFGSDKDIGDNLWFQFLGILLFDAIAAPFTVRNTFLLFSGRHHAGDEAGTRGFAGDLFPALIDQHRPLTHATGQGQCHREKQYIARHLATWGRSDFGLRSARRCHR